MKINPHVFKAYDIRGVYPTDINEDFAYRLGFAFADLRQKEENKDDLTVLVSRDMRLSSPQLSESLIKGLLESGVNVIDIGLASTPTMYFASAFYHCDGGIQVSASHNPKDDNGFKIVRDKAIPVSEDTGMYDLREMVINNKLQKAEKPGTITTKTTVLDDLYKSELEELHIDISQIKPFKIVIDASNSMGALDTIKIFEKLPCELVKLNFELDGSFPAHQPDPLVDANLQSTIDAVKSNHADLGIVPDGDGDRYFFIDNEGQIIRQEIIRGIMAQIALLEHPGATIGYDIRPGKITLDMILKASGKPLVTRVGHSLIKESMLKNDAVFGGESSGHYFYKFRYGTFEAPFALVLKFLIYISKQNKSVADIVRPLKKYFHSGEINSFVADKAAKIKELASKYKDAQNISFLDGVTIEYPNYWFNVRPSNTENKLRLNLEAIDQKTMEQKCDEVLNLIRS
ncbi:MAG: phosphomannomutase/phosphoglucomutase [bacterium]